MNDVDGGDVDVSRLKSMLIRPPQTLQNLPVEYRWEVTRRHPYYLLFWKSAHEHRQGLLKNPLEEQIGAAAVLVLHGIGVTGDPPPPDSGPDVLQMDQLAQAWRGGAVAPLTLRSLAGILISDAPREIRLALGELLVRSAEPSEDELTMKYEVTSALLDNPNKALDGMPNRPILGINLNAPQRAIAEAVEQMVRDLKKQLDIPEQRRREEVLPEYLDVWDLREGWSGDHYEIEKEQSFEQISRKLSVPVRTIANRYYSAFRLICGHAYSFENWLRLFYVIKLSSALGNQSLRGRKTISPPRKSEAVKQVVESVLDTNREPGKRSFLDGAATVPSGTEETDLMIDISEMIKGQYNDAAIIRNLELSGTREIRDAIQYLRQRGQESST